MTEQHWERVEVVSGDIQAELLRGLLEAQGLQVLLSKEGAGNAMGLQIGPLAEIEIFVPSESADLARRILAEYDAGGFSEGDNGEAEEKDPS